MSSLIRSSFLAASCLLLSATAPVRADPPAPLPVAPLTRTSAVDFETEIAPFLRRNCFACHNETKAKADLILETPEAIRDGGESGPAVKPGDADASLLFTLAAHQDDPVMPPPENKSHAVNLKPQELALLRLWIAQGAKGTGRISLPAPATWQKSTHEPIYSVAVSPDGRFAACGRGHQVHVYDLTLQSLVATLTDPALGDATHRDFVHSLAFSADGTIASGGYREVKLWRKPEVAPLATFPAPAPGPPTTVAVSGDGRWRAVGSADGSLHLQDLSRPDAPTVAIKDHPGPVRALCFLPDSSALVSASEGRVLCLRKLEHPAQSQRLTLPVEAVSLASLAEGAKIAFGSPDNKIRLFPTAAFTSGAAPETLSFEELAGGSAPSVLLRTARLGDAECLLSAGTEPTVRIWNLATKSVLRQISVGVAVAALEVSPNGSQLIVQRATPGPARLFKLSDGALIKDLELDPASTVRASALQAEEQLTSRLLTVRKTELPKLEEQVKSDREEAAQAEKELPKAKEALAAKQADMDRAKAAMQLAEDALRPVPESDAKLAALQKALETARTALETAETARDEAKRAEAGFTSRRELALQRASDGAAKVDRSKTQLAALETKLKDLAAQREQLRVRQGTETPKLQLAGVAFSKDGSRVATALPDGRIHFFHPGTGAWLDAILTRPGISALGLYPDDQLFVWEGGGGLVSWRTARHWALSGTIGDGSDAAIFPDRVTALAFRADGSLLATGSGVPSRTGEVKFWEPASRRLVAANADAHGDAVSDLKFSPDGAQAVAASTDKMVRTFDTRTGKLNRTFEAHTGQVLGVAWSHDGRRIASVSADRELRIWDPDTGDQIRTLKGWEGEITGVAFASPAGEQVVTACGDKKLRLDNGVFATTESFQHALAVTGDGRLLAAGGEDGVLRIWNGARQLVSTFPPPPPAGSAEGVASRAPVAP